jgi:hypothetical protein
MKNFELSEQFKIIGVGSASGLLYQDNNILLICDNSTYLYDYQIDSNQLNRYPLAENPQENISKKDKLDFEAIAQHEQNLYVFGSGSTKNRNKMIHLDNKTKAIIATIDVTHLYKSMQTVGKILPEDFNIEGAIYDGKTWFLFNRGNGKLNKNVLFSIEGDSLTDNFKITATEYKLPKIKGVFTSFTDAILIDKTIYFLATAENTDSTYADGEVFGSILGSIDCQTLKIGFTKKITNTHKFEGITLVNKSNEKIEFYLCEDNDTEILESTIYKLIVPFD